MKDFKERIMHLATTVPGALIIVAALAFLYLIVDRGHATVGELALIIAGIAGGGAAVAYKKNPQNKV